MLPVNGTGSHCWEPGKPVGSITRDQNSVKTEQPKARGGKRKNAGRKPTGRKVVTRSVSMEPETWDKLDTLRAEKSRGQWIAEKVRKAR
jgi:hypothetical protein